MAEISVDVVVNGVSHTYTGDGEQPLLWYLRDTLALTGTKFACGIAACGACTVQVDGRAERACTMPMREVGSRRVLTIEGLADSAGAMHPVQQAWMAENVPQCGYCQSGQMMATAALLAANPEPDDAAIDRALAGNLCRCGTYARIRRAVHRAAALQKRVSA